MIPHTSAHIHDVDILSNQREAMKLAAEAWVSKRIWQMFHGRPVKLSHDGGLVDPELKQYADHELSAFRYLVQGINWDPEWFVELTFDCGCLNVRVKGSFE